MNKRTPVSAYRLFSSPSNKQIVYINSRRSPCMLTNVDKCNKFNKNINKCQLKSKNATEEESQKDQVVTASKPSRPLLT